MLPKQTRPGAPKVKALASLTDRIQVIRKNQLSHSSSDNGRLVKATEQLASFYAEDYKHLAKYLAPAQSRQMVKPEVLNI